MEDINKIKENIKNKEISLIENKIELLDIELEVMINSSKAGCKKEFKSESINYFICGEVGVSNHFCSECAEKIRGKQSKLIRLYEELNNLN